MKDEEFKKNLQKIREFKKIAIEKLEQKKAEDFENLEKRKVVTIRTLLLRALSQVANIR